MVISAGAGVTLYVLPMFLRDYQQEMLDRLKEAWTRYRHVMVQMPTGTGKTHLMAKVIDEQMAEGVLIVAHRIELIGQISDTLDRFGVSHGRIDRTTADAEEVMRRHSVVVASIQTLARRMGHTIDTESAERAKGTESVQDKKRVPGLVIVDEAHHAVAKTYRWLWDKWPEAKFLGLTATPCRLNNSGFTDLFDTLLQSYSIMEFIDKGWLADFEYVSVTPDNWMVERIAGLKKRGVDGDYQTKEMATVMDSQESIAHLYNSYEQYAKGKKGIVYAISREHAQHIAEYYVSKGVRCCWIEAQTPADVRQQLVDDYRQGRMDVIVNVDIFSEGFNCPEVEFIQLARPTLSLSKYLQQVGRGMRVVEGKDYVTILDQVGMYQTFGLPTEERDWSLMFRGKVSGRGLHGGDQRYIIRDEPNLTLVNLEMVRIKRHGEKCDGVELFIQGGKYGVLKDGHEICAPEFERVQRMEAPYFVMGTFPYYVFKNKVTVVDMDGHVLNPGLYGNVKLEGDVFIGQDIQGRPLYWDSKGGRYYKSMPKFEQLMRLEVARVGEEVYMRQSTKQWEKPIDVDHIYLHELFFIIGDKLIFRSDMTKAYEVCGYDSGFIHIRYPWNYDRKYPYACVGRLGNISSYERTLPSTLSQRPLNISMMGMKRLMNKKSD